MGTEEKGTADAGDLVAKAMAGTAKVPLAVEGNPSQVAADMAAAAAHGKPLPTPAPPDAPTSPGPAGPPVASGAYTSASAPPPFIPEGGTMRAPAQGEAEGLLADIASWFHAVSTEDRPGWARDEEWRRDVGRVGYTLSRFAKVVVGDGERLHQWARERLGVEWVARRFEVTTPRKKLTWQAAREHARLLREDYDGREGLKPKFLMDVIKALEEHADAVQGVR